MSIVELTEITDPERIMDAQETVEKTEEFQRLRRHYETIAGPLEQTTVSAYHPVGNQDVIQILYKGTTTEGYPTYLKAQMNKPNDSISYSIKLAPDSPTSF